MRKLILLNHDWKFTKPAEKTKQVNLPHTWNHLDGQDGGNDYWRGTCRYEKTFAAPEFDPAFERIWIQFEGVNASAVVTLNGTSVISHEGGYSTFRADITEYLKADNHLVVEVDNSLNDSIYPQKADFTFYGGIYRNVTLMIVHKNHFALGYFGGCGVKVTPKIHETDHSYAAVRVESFVEGTGHVKINILDADGIRIADDDGYDITMILQNPHLWEGVKNPYLYTVEANLYNMENHTEILVDQVRTRIGIRSFHIDSKMGFYLNGRPYRLHGVSRHQDRKNRGNAVTREMHLEDMALIKEIGANTIRLAHYQHDQYFYDLCDEAGMVVWAEIPYISEHLPKGKMNTVSQMKELIIQNYNHPSICVWGISNEITISTKDKRDMLENHRILNNLCHQMDRGRLTTLACYAVCSPFHPVAHITDVVSWNLYLGWYVPGLFLNDLWIRFFHLIYPNRALGFSEYGAEGMPCFHSEHPRRGDQTEEYQAKYHEFMLRCFEHHPWLWATHVWNMFDFAADARDQGGEPGMNHKGLVTFDRKVKKDSFFLYKAWWSEDPFVHICSKRFTDRTKDRIEVKVYSNQKRVELYVNESKAEIKDGEKIFRFQIPLSETTKVKALSGNCTDEAVFYRTDKPNADYKVKKSRKSNWV